MWEVLARGMLGFVVMVDVTREASIRDARAMIKYFRKLSGVPFVIGANKAPSHPEGLRALRSKLGITKDKTVVPCEANNRESAKEVLLALLVDVLELVDAEPVPVGSG
jgi:signal recognition particle receptor subunit beta